MSSYTPPPGNAVPLDFTGGPYTPPAGNAVPLEFRRDAVIGEQQYLFPAGFTQAAFGSHALRKSFEYVTPLGIAPGGFGAVSIRLGHQLVSPAGWVQTQWGSYAGTTVVNFNKEVRPSGFNAFRGFGTHWVSLGTRRIYPGLGVQTRWGNPTMAGGVRWLDLAGRGIAGSAYGRPIIWFHTRELFPSWFVATRYGAPLVDFNHDVEPTGIPPGGFGVAEVHRPRSLVDLWNQGIAGPLWGDHRVDNYTRYIAPQGFITAPTEHERFGWPEVWLWRRYIQQLFEVTPSDGGVFGNFNYVENRDRYPRPEGIRPGPFGTGEVRNNARVIRTPANQEHTLWGANMVSHSERFLLPLGEVQTQWGSPLGWIVHNAARVLAPAGWVSSTVGRPERVWGNRQWLGHVGGADTSSAGTPMVAFRIRTVQQFAGPDLLRIGAARVQHWERYVAPPGVDAFRAGVPTLEEHFTVIAPRSILPPTNQVGDSSRVWNLTPELYAFGATMTEWGGTRVFNQWRAFDFQGFDSQVFGRHVVKDRRQTVTPPGVMVLTIPLTHQVRNVEPDPPAPQTIAPAGMVPGTSPGWAWMGSPIVTANRIVPAGGIHTLWGNPRVVSMGILAQGIPPPYSTTTGSQFGTPSLPAAQYVTPAGILSLRTGEPHMWPHYIWAPQGYPYTTGRDNEKGHIMDFNVHGWNHPERPVFGSATVTNKDRAIFPSGRAMLAMPDGARVSLNPQYIRAEGTRFTRYGFPIINGGGEVAASGFDMALYGSPVVVEIDTRPKEAKPSGFMALGWGVHRVEHFHRTLHPSGWVSFAISAPRPPAWPRTSHWVSNAYPPFQFTGSDTSLFGTAWVSNWVRELAPAGFDAHRIGYEPGYFAQRMKVWKRDYVRDVTLGDGEVFGTAWVEQGERSIAVRAISPGGVPRPQVIGRATVAPDGFDACVFGDVQRWEAGKVKPYGDDLAEWGRTIISRALRAQGFDGEFGVPSVARPIAAEGWIAGGVGEPTTVARWCGNKAMAVEGNDMAQFGEAAVTT